MQMPSSLSSWFPGQSCSWPPGRTGYGRRRPWHGPCQGACASTATRMATRSWNTPRPGTASAASSRNRPPASCRRTPPINPRQGGPRRRVAKGRQVHPATANTTVTSRPAAPQAPATRRHRPAASARGRSRRSRLGRDGRTGSGGGWLAAEVASGGGWLAAEAGFGSRLFICAGHCKDWQQVRADRAAHERANLQPGRSSRGWTPTPAPSRRSISSGR